MLKCNFNREQVSVTIFSFTVILCLLLFLCWVSFTVNILMLHITWENFNVHGSCDAHNSSLHLISATESGQAFIAKLRRFSTPILHHWLRRIIAGLSPQGPSFCLKLSNVICVGQSCTGTGFLPSTSVSCC